MQAQFNHCASHCTVCNSERHIRRPILEIGLLKVALKTWDRARLSCQTLPLYLIRPPGRSDKGIGR